MTWNGFGLMIMSFSFLTWWQYLSKKKLSKRRNHVQIPRRVQLSQVTAANKLRSRRRTRWVLSFEYILQDFKYRDPSPVHFDISLDMYFPPKLNIQRTWISAYSGKKLQWSGNIYSWLKRFCSKRFHQK